MYNNKFKKGDLIKIIAGKHKGVEGPVVSVLREKKRVLIEGITNIRHVKPSNINAKGEIKQILTSIHISNIALINPKNKKEITKISYKLINVSNKIKKIRIARKSKVRLS